MKEQGGSGHYKIPLGLIFAGVVFLILNATQTPSLMGRLDPTPLYLAYACLTLGTIGLVALSVASVNRRARDAHSRWWHKEQSRRDHDSQKRRDDARTSCEILYELYAHALTERFPRDVFTDFVARLLNDHHPPDVVEQRAGELRSLIQKHADKIEPPPPKKMTLANLAQWLVNERKMIEETALSDDDKQLLLSQLEERYVRLQEKYFRSVHP